MATVKAIAICDGWNSSSVASATVTIPSGVSGGTVTLFDYEDHKWSYYSDEECPIHSLNPADVKITYYGNGSNTVASTNDDNPTSFTGNAMDVKVGIDTDANTFVYYKTLERMDGSTAATPSAATGRCAYTTIPNPFSVRPTYGSGDTRWRGFYKWRVKKVSGGTIHSASTGGATYAQGSTINAEEEIYFAPSSEYGMEVEFEALWARAYVVTTNTTSGLKSSVSYERNFVYLSTNTTLRNAALSCPVTYTTLDPSTGDGTKRTITIRDGFTCNANTKFENLTFAQYSNNAQTLTANGHDLIVGRGCSGTVGTVRGMSDGSSNAVDYTIRLESGTFGTFNMIDGTTRTHSGTVSAKTIFGCDYDRANKDNDKLSISNNSTVYGASNYQSFSGSANRNNLTYDWLIKSGKVQSNKSVADAAAENCIYMGNSGSSSDSDGNKYQGKRRLIMEGGEVCNIAGGLNNYGDNRNNYIVNDGGWTLQIRMKGGTVRGSIYGAAAFAGASGDRLFIFTGGNIGGWIAGGANGTEEDGGVLHGASYIYVGGKIQIDSKGSNNVINRAVGGNVFGAGCGNSSTSNSGQVTQGTNVVIADDAYVERGVYGGGSYGFTTATSNIYILGGTVDGKSGGANGTNFREEIDGGVYGGACQNQGGTVNVIMNDGIINGSVYGGSNYTGTLSGTSTVTLNGGTINGSLYGGGNGEGSVNTNIDGAVQVNVYGGTVTDAVYGCNNNAGAPQSTVKVDIYGTDPAPAEGEYALHAVYGGGNKASYNRTPIVTVHNCDNSIEYVYGGGNAAAVAATDVTIWGGNVIGNVFGGGNGESGTAADVNGNVDLKICGGTIRNVFGGSNSLGEIEGDVNVNVNSQGEGEKTPCPMIIGNVYGGGNEADGNAGTLTIGCTGALVEGDEGHLAHPENIGKTLEGIGAVYGGANNANIGTSETPSNITLNINSGMVANVFGGNNTSGNIYGNITVNVNKNAETCGWYVGNVYGAGNLAAYTGSPVVNIQNGTVSGNVFGGGLGKTAIVKGNPQVTIGDAVAEHTAIVGGDVYGGGDAANVVGTPVVNIVNKCNTTIGNVYGGGNAADVNGTDVNIDGGTITGMVFGGGHGDNSAEPQISANVNGNVNLDITGGTINKVFGGSNSMGNITGSIALNIQKVDGHCDMRIAEVYGGGNEADGNAGSLTIGCTGALVEGDEGHLAHPENIGKTLEGIGAVYGGANNANIGNDVTLNINSGMVAKVFGGNNTGGTVNGNVTVNVNKSANTCGWYVGKVHGGGYGKETNVAKDVTVNIENGTIYGDVYGGSALGKVNTDTDNTTTVNLKGGIIKGDAYGGGLGDSTTEADVNGNVTVTLNGTAFELTTTTDDKGNSIPTSGRIFGCNNINGSPKGTVLVWVQKTVGPTNEKPAKGSGIYELQAVYGGGNLAAYKPENSKANGQFTSYTYDEINVPHDNTNKPVQVVIDGCDKTSIEYVYGGGNAAATPATDVTILGSYEIGSVFGGGNGKDRYTLDGGTTWNENEGADVGVINATAYKADNSQGKYGTGNAMTSVLGGTVHNIYGGSNMKGNIVGNAVAYLDAASGCELNAGDIYGGGNEAYMDGGSGIQLGCITYLKEIYGGARNADVGGDINLTITSGHFDRIFGGNNLGGAIKGSITVNIEETGCNPITIGELYGCGNKAAYDTPEGKQDPTLNIRSFTSIGNVYGGGLGEEAVVTGNPTVNINVVKGVNNAVKDWLYNDGRTIDFGDDYKVTLPVHEEGKIGAIGTVFGGGNAAKVIGNTNVNIGTEVSVVFESLKGTEAERTKTVEGADIRGNVYGGGNKADVTGKTNVKVGKN